MIKQEVGNQLALPEQIAAFVERVCEKQNLHSATIRPPHMLIPLDSGNGRSRMARIIAKRYFEAKACAFSSRDIFLDLTMSGTIQSINEVNAEIQTSAEYSNHFQGVIALNIDAILPHLGDASGAKFFELVSKIKKHATLMLFVPAECSQKHLDLIVERIGASIISFPATSYNDKELTRLFCGFLPPAISPPGLQATKRPGSSKDGESTKLEERIGAYISQSVRSKTIKNIKEAAEALFFNDEATEMLFGGLRKSKETVVTRQVPATTPAAPA